jgi:hypothetical protein
MKPYRHRLLLSAACAAAALLLGGADAPPPTAAPTTQESSVAVLPPPPEVIADTEKYIKQLNAESWQDRQRAQDALVAMGHWNQERLRQALKDATEEEVRTRLEAAIRQIEDARNMGTSLISLSVKNGSPKDVFAELARQSNAPIRVQPANLWESRQFAPITLQVDKQPFWLALKQVCEATGLAPINTGTDREMVVADRAAGMRVWGEAPTNVSGPFLVTCNQINRNHYVDLNQPKNVRRQCNVMLMVYAEPKLRVLQGSYNARLEEAVDEKGNSLLAPGMQYEQLQPGNSWAWNVNCNLMPPEGAGAKIAKLKGTGRFLLQTRSEKTEISDVLAARNETRAAGGKRFTLKEVRRTGDSYQLVITLYRSGWQQNEWNYMYTYNAFRLVDGKGNPLTRVSNSTAHSNAESMEMTLTYQRVLFNDAAGEPAKLLWEVPTETKEVVVPFEFTDLPLP